MRRTALLSVRLPREMGLAPEHAKWRQEYEPWKHLRRTANLAGTGFYIPPEWYQHFRMFPPVQNQFLEEQTLNPYNDSEQTQPAADQKDALRNEIRKELGMHSRSMAAEGNRYFNIFWVEKSMDKAERSYHLYKGRGYTHTEAIRKALEEYYEEQTLKKRAHIIQCEEAKLSGKFLTMREASSMLTALSRMTTLTLAPHEFSVLAGETAEAVATTPVKRGRSRTIPRAVEIKSSPATADATTDGSTTTAAAPGAEPVPSPAAADQAVAPTEAPAADATAPATSPANTANDLSAFDLADILEQDASQVTVVEAVETAGESLPKLRERSLGGVGHSGWYKGPSPTFTGSPQ
jgi:hypothetical protein